MIQLRLKVDGENEGGVGKWIMPYCRRGKRMAHKYSKSGTKAEYRVPVGQNRMKSGFKNFDDYDPQTKEFVDYKDWSDTYPLKNSPMYNSAVKDATTQAEIAKDYGTTVRWEVPTDAAKANVDQLIQKGVDENLQQYIKVIVNPK